MRDVLLKVQELNEADVDWLCSIGLRQNVLPNTVLMTQGKPAEFLYIVLEGVLAAIISQDGSDPLAKAFAALEGEEALGTELTRFTEGEVADELSAVDHRSAIATIKAVRRTVVLAIPWPALATKLTQDLEFAARFNQALAVRLSNRLRSVVVKLSSGKAIVNPSSSLRKVLFVFRELSDGDIDWISQAGKREQLTEGTVLIQEGEPNDAFYILLDGSLSVSVSQASSPLAKAYAVLEGGVLAGQKLAKLSKGEIVGEMSFLDNRPPSASVTTLEKSLVLAIPRQQLSAKLQQDSGFAARFYRAIAVLLADRLRNTVSQIGFGQQAYTTGQSLSRDVEYEDELDLETLDQMELAGTRLDWMLSRLRGS